MHVKGRVARGRDEHGTGKFGIRTNCRFRAAANSGSTLVFLRGDTADIHSERMGLHCGLRRCINFKCTDIGEADAVSHCGEPNLRMLCCGQHPADREQAAAASVRLGRNTAEFKRAIAPLNPTDHHVHTATCGREYSVAKNLCFHRGGVL